MPERTLHLAHSPDSDDLVMWWPLTGMRGPDGRPVGGELGSPRIGTPRFVFETVGVDVEALNKSTAEGNDAFDITAISAAAYPAICEEWAITRCGGSFGDGYGPRVVVREDSHITAVEDLRGATIAVPGTRTSAFLALSMLVSGMKPARSAGVPGAGVRGFGHEAMLFSDVPGAVAEGRADAGLLIHEAQLTFGQMGLRKVVDLGEWWTDRTGLALPLGLNVLRRDLDERFGEGTVEAVSRVLSASVNYAVEHADESRRYLLLHSEGRPEWRNEALVNQYLSMYVSRISVEMGERGVAALRRFLGEGAERGFVGEASRIDVV